MIVASSNSGFAQQPPKVGGGLKISASAPLYERYLYAGEIARSKKDQATARKYFVGALADFERVKPEKTKVHMLTRIDRDVMYAYRPQGQAPLAGDPSIEEQEAVFNRLLALDQRWGVKDGIIAKAVAKRQQTAEAEAREQAKQAGGPKTQ
jgi:uncharacterized protein (DUF4415 family)